MKRAVIIGTGTIAGVAAVLGLNPDPATTATPVASSSVSTGTTTTPDTGTGTGTTATPDAGSSTGGTTSTGTSTVAGSVVDVGHGYGNVQVEVTITDGRIVNVTALELPENDPRSSQISNRALPTLVQQALQAQTSDIAGVSGASYTSYGFVESLRAALTEAGLAS